jgi:hypothetical protein
LRLLDTDMAWAGRVKHQTDCVSTRMRRKKGILHTGDSTYFYPDSLILTHNGSDLA